MKIFRKILKLMWGFMKSEKFCTALLWLGVIILTIYTNFLINVTETDNLTVVNIDLVLVISIIYAKTFIQY